MFYEAGSEPTADFLGYLRRYFFTEETGYGFRFNGDDRLPGKLFVDWF
jgi:hypothetical protein